MTKIMVDIEGLLNFSEAARILSVSRPTVYYNYIPNHHLRIVTIHGIRFLLKEEVEALKAKLEKEGVEVAKHA